MVLSRKHLYGRYNQSLAARRIQTVRPSEQSVPRTQPQSQQEPPSFETDQDLSKPRRPTKETKRRS